MEKIEQKVRAKRMQFSLRTLVLGVLAAALLLFPFSTQICPQWSVHVIDEMGKPVTGARVNQSWCYYSLESSDQDHLDDRFSDAYGDSSFPERRIRACILMRILAVPRFIFCLPHASFGASAYIVVSSDGYKSDFMSQNDKSITKDNQGNLRCEIVLHSERNAPIGPFPTPPTSATQDNQSDR